MRDNRLTNILLILLLAFNVIFISTWWFKHKREHRKPPVETHSKGTTFLIDQLGLDSVQDKKVEALRKDHFQKLGMYEAAIARNEKAVILALASNPADSVQANMHADSVGTIKTAMNKEFFKYFKGIKQLCTPEQSSKFDALIEDMSKEFHHKDTHHPGNGARHDSI